MLKQNYVDDFCHIIDTYGGRDKVMKALCYASKLISGYYINREPELAKRCAIASSRISEARITLRLIDDIPIIQNALKYNFDQKEDDKISSSLGFLGNIVDLINLPLIKLCWLCDHEIIHLKNKKLWSNMNTMCWFISVYINLIKTIREITNYQQKYGNFKGEIFSEKSTNLLLILKKHRMEILSLVRLTLDFIHAASCLPKEYICNKKLTTFQVGIIGTASALIGLYQTFIKQQNK